MSLSVEIEKRLGNFALKAAFEAESETLALLGASGCGKSVTLKCIAGLMTPDRGRIVLDGRVLFDSERRIDLPPQKRRVGYLFQQYALFPGMTVEENVRCALRTGTRGEKRAAAARKIRSFRLEGLEKKYPAQLSGGEQQRVALARILASEPGAIFLDEPFSALDSYLKWNLEQELADLLSGFRGTVLWVSHDRDECYRNCRRVCVMENGATGPVTTMEDLLHRPGSVSAARLAGCRNFFSARPCGEGTLLSDWNIALPVPPPENVSAMAVPAEAVDLSGKEITCAVCRVIREVEHTDVLLRPLSCAPDVCGLWAEYPGEASLRIGDRVSLSLRPDKILLW